MEESEFFALPTKTSMLTWRPSQSPIWRVALILKLKCGRSEMTESVEMHRVRSGTTFRTSQLSLAYFVAGKLGRHYQH
jgi:hypothetical protein